MEIRPGRPEEADTMVEFQLKMAQETEGIRLDPATVAAGVRAVFAAPRKGRYWVAEEGDQLAASLLVTPEWSDWRNATVWWIQSLYVREAYRRQGVFRMMFEHLRRLVEADDDLLGLRLYVAADNAAAQRGYEAMGMDCRRYRTYEWLK